jgi:hypothetical protein
MEKSAYRGIRDSLRQRHLDDPRRPLNREWTPMNANQRHGNDITQHPGPPTLPSEGGSTRDTSPCPIQTDTPESFRGWTCTVVERDKASEGLLASRCNTRANPSR